MKLTIIIPVYNEESTVLELFKRVVNAKIKNLEKEIIIIDDGSIDKTKSKIELFKTRKKFTRVKKIFHKNNLGKGASIRDGLKLATGDFVLIQDADLEYDPSYYLKLLNPLLDNTASIVYGTRLTDYPLKFWGREKTVLPVHLIANKFLTMLTNLLYGSNLTDMETCYKLFRRDILDNIDINSNRFEFEPEVTVKVLKSGYKIKEVSIKAYPRTYQEGKKIGWKDGLMAIWILLKYKFVN